MTYSAPQYSQVKTLQQTILHYSNDQTCIDAVAAMRWPEGKPTCPSCGHKDHYWLASQKRWKCKECWKQFSVKVGTIFEDSPISLSKWLVAMRMVGNCKNGISSWEIHRAIGVCQKNRIVHDAQNQTLHASWFVRSQTGWRRKAG